MKILHITSTFVPSKFGGAVQLSYDLAKALAVRGHTITVYSTDAEAGRLRLSNVRGVKDIDGIAVRYYRNLSNWLAYKYRLFLPLGARASIRQEIINFDVVHLHEFRSLLSLFTSRYAKAHDIPYIIDQHGSLPRSHGKRAFKWLVRWLFDVTFGYRMLRDARAVVGETEVGVNEIKGFGVSQDRIILITPPFPVEEFSQLPPPGRFRDKYNLIDKKIVMFLGRIHWIKGLDFLAAGFYQLSKARSDAILVIVGPDDGYKSTLEHQINQLHLSDRVLFTGFLGGDEKLSALVDADVVIQTSRYEQGAWAPLEAVLCDTPIIVSSNSGAGEDVKKIDAGYLVEYGNAIELRDMIQYIFNNPAEAKLKTKKAKEYIKANMSMAKGVEKYEELYKNVIKRGRQ